MTVSHDESTLPQLKETIAEVEKKLIMKTLKETSWVQSRAAKKLGISPRMLSYKIKKYGITIKPKQRRRER